jgi:hypothetical protein
MQTTSGNTDEENFRIIKSLQNNDASSNKAHINKQVQILLHEILMKNKRYLSRRHSFEKFRNQRVNFIKEILFNKCQSIQNMHRLTDYI